MKWADAAKKLGISVYRLKKGVREEDWPCHDYGPHNKTFTDEDLDEIRELTKRRIPDTQPVVARLSPQHLALIAESGSVEAARERILAAKRERRGVGQRSRSTAA